MATTQDQNDSKPNSWLGFIYYGIWFLLIVDGLWGYVQHIILKKKYIPTTLFVALIFMLLITHGFKKPQKRPEFKVMYMMACWMIVTVLVGSQINFASPFKIIFGLYVNYWYVFIAVFAMGSSFRINEKQFVWLFFLTAAPLVLLGIAQGIKQDNFAIGIWISQEADANNLGFFGKRRANSTFAHASDFGLFCGIVTSIALAFLLKSKSTLHKIGWLGIIAVALAAIYFTYTRTAYLIDALAMGMVFAIFMLKDTKHASLLSKVPFVFLAFGIVVYFATPLIQFFSSSNTMFSSASLGERIYGNNYYLHELSKAGWHTIFTGLGWFINGHYKASIPIDNQYIGILLSTGLVGLVLWFILTYCIWRGLLLKALKSDSPVAIGLAAVATPWLAHSVFDVNSTMALVAIIGYTIQTNSSNAEKNPQH